MTVWIASCVGRYKTIRLAPAIGKRILISLERQKHTQTSLKDSASFLYIAMTTLAQGRAKWYISYIDLSICMLHCTSNCNIALYCRGNELSAVNILVNSSSEVYKVCISFLICFGRLDHASVCCWLNLLQSSYSISYTQACVYVCGGGDYSSTFHYDSLPQKCKVCSTCRRKSQGTRIRIF